MIYPVQHIHPSHRPGSRRLMHGLLAVACLTSLGGCAGVAGGMRNEQKGPEGLLVSQVEDLGFNKPGNLVPAGKTSYRIASIPKSYEVLLDLNEQTDSGFQNQDVSSTEQSLAQQMSGSYLGGLMQIEAGSGEQVPGQYGAAPAWRRAAYGKAVYTRTNLVERRTEAAAADLFFVHELVEMLPPHEEVTLEPFGKVISVTTGNDGVMTSQTREPVYTVTVPAKHRLVVIAKDPKTQAELSKAVYATWTKEHKYFRAMAAKDKKFFANEEEALAGFTADKEAFAKQITEGELFEARKPKNLKDLPVTDLNVLSPDAAWGSLITRSKPAPFIARPPSGDAAQSAWQAQATWFTWTDAQKSWKLKPEFIRDATWVTAASIPLVAVRDDAKASAPARAAAALTLATYRATLLDLAGAKSQIAKALELSPGCLDEANHMIRGGLMDHGEEYYMGRYHWLGLERTITGVQNWQRSAVKGAQIPAAK